MIVITPTIEPTDAALLAGCGSAPDQFRVLFDRHAPAVFAFLAARVGHEAAQDLTADVFAIAFEQRSSFDPAAASARPWLYGIAANKLRHHRQAERRWFRNSAAALRDRASDDAAAADERMDAAARAGVLVQALADLRPGERDALLLHALEGFDNDEIAAALGIRPGAARTRLSRGRARLREALGTIHPEEASP
jgi:RNA polymerase sigma-70 factor (ECF subfamily)